MHHSCPLILTWLAHSILPSTLHLHTSEVPSEDGLLSPILDTGATHCLLPLDWLTPTQAATSKRIHLKVASGSSVRALLFNNLIFCATVSRPLLSVGQLKAMLGLEVPMRRLFTMSHRLFRRFALHPFRSIDHASFARSSLRRRCLS